MSEATMFIYWLDQEDESSMTRADLQFVALHDVKHLPVCDLVYLLYHGRDSYAMLALKELRLRFRDEMNAMSEQNQHQEREEC